LRLPARVVAWKSHLGHRDCPLMFQTEFRDAAIDATWDMRQGYGDRSLFQTTVQQQIVAYRSERLILHTYAGVGSRDSSDHISRSRAINDRRFPIHRKVALEKRVLLPSKWLSCELSLTACFCPSCPLIAVHAPDTSDEIRYDRIRIDSIAEDKGRLERWIC
jgi:hypothetical protein